jgi:type II secretory pathway component GspD/PulD (secretin)
MAKSREIRIFHLKIARAEELAKTIDAMYPEPPVPIDPRTRQPRPDLRVHAKSSSAPIASTNSLIVDAPARRLSGFEQIVRSLDQQKLTGDTETAHLPRAPGRSERRGNGHPAQRGLQRGALTRHEASNTPVTVDVEPVSRTLIVSGPSESFAAVDERC